MYIRCMCAIYIFLPLIAINHNSPLIRMVSSYSYGIFFIVFLQLQIRELLQVVWGLGGCGAVAMQMLSKQCQQGAAGQSGLGPGRPHSLLESCFNRFISACSQDILYFLIRSEFILSRKILIPSPPFFILLTIAVLSVFPCPFLLPFHSLLFPDLFFKIILFCY